MKWKAEEIDRLVENIFRTLFIQIGILVEILLRYDVHSSNTVDMKISLFIIRNFLPFARSWTFDIHYDLFHFLEILL